MRNLFLAAVLASCLVTAPAVHAEAPAVQRMGAYVVSDDLDRSAAFYEKLFGRAPQVRTPGLVGFDVAGGFYAIVSKATYAPNAVAGGNVVPYLKVADIDAWLTQVEAVAPNSLITKAVVREGPFALIKFTDPDGNMVEMYSVTPPAPAK